ncbi:hypothetical protein B0H67DRAFT_549843 [Lasiosphaeris hirsuta]|uniref:Uncharacterized protein n=1 Tax=Lasiosphaeris hirsuta TaxID=260670 RepID=A0AA40BDH5_9PEZI|nr:hypothetical protein B0H67DRAFT_558816 [Lasiosphaeris hirsuta]KAK0732240.1 hypothetical protein B0H67DRAFT_549843 [Lasiosphaeris hirsuta]
MLSTVKALAALGLLAGCVNGGGKEVHYAPTTIYETTTVEKTHLVDVTIYNTQTKIVKTYLTESTTVTLHYTVSVTSTALATITNTDTDSVTTTDTDSTTVTTTDTDSTTVTTTDTDSTTVTTTGTDSTTVTTTETDSTTITTTETDSTTVTTTDTDSTTVTDTDSTTITLPTTTYTTRTIFSTTYDPCPKSCSVSAETVTLYFWPTNRPYTYPQTYVDPTLSYTFTSPSVYMFIPAARGINTLGQPTGPSTAAWMLGLPLHQVSTIIYGSNATRQLTLADLGTDCPQTADPTAIATMVDARCNPVLAAPREVSSWAYPCNACGQFGLFDPPYAVPPLTGVLVEPTATTRTTPLPTTTRIAPLPTGTITAGPTVPTVPGATSGPPGTTTGVATAGVARLGVRWVLVVGIVGVGAVVMRM